MAKHTLTLQVKKNPFYNIVVQLCVWFPIWARKRLGHVILASIYIDGEEQPSTVIKVEDVFKSLSEDAEIEFKKNFKISVTDNISPKLNEIQKSIDKLNLN